MCYLFSLYESINDIRYMHDYTAALLTEMQLGY